jgi:hypothetical protein
LESLRKRYETYKTFKKKWLLSTQSLSFLFVVV